MKKQNKKANRVGRIGELDPGLIKIGYMKLLKCKRKVITHVELYRKNKEDILESRAASKYRAFKKSSNQLLVCRLGDL